MRDYSKVSPRLWTGTLGKGIKGDPHAQALAAYLITSQHCNMIGLYHLPIAYAASDLGWSEKDLTKALHKVCQSGFAEYDEEAERVWITEHARHELGSKENGTMGRGDKRIHAIRALLKDHRISFLFNKFLVRYGEDFHLEVELLPEGDAKGLRRGFTGPMASQEQEQEQEQEPIQDAPHPAASGAEDGKPHPQRVRVKRVLDLWEDIPPEVKHPDGGLVASWLKSWSDDDALVRALSDLKDSGKFGMGAGYVTSCLRTAYQNGKKVPQTNGPRAPGAGTHATGSTPELREQARKAQLDIEGMDQ